MKSKREYTTYSKNQETPPIVWSHYVVMIFLFVCVALYLIADSDNTVYAVENILFQITILTFICFILSLLFFLATNASLVFIIFTVNTLLVFLLVGLHVNSIGFRFLIVSILFVQYSVKLPSKVSFPLSVAMFLGIMAIQTNKEVFGFTFIGVPAPEIIFLNVSELTVIFIAHFQKYIIHKNKNLKKEIALKDTTINRLTNTNLKFQDYAFTIENASRLEERFSITREVHDITGYTLISLIMMLEYGEDLLLSNNKEKLLEVLNTARQQARNGHNEIRMALKHLRSIQATPVPLTNRIYKIVDNFKQVTEMNIQLEFTNFHGLEHNNYDNFILRFIQEGLTNSFRHGKATQVDIIIFQEKHTMLISLEDNGIGSSSIVEGIGLKGMNERIEQQGGSLQYRSTQWGFSLQARLPINQNKDKAVTWIQENKK